MVTKAVTYRLDAELVKRLSAWSLLLEKDKTAIIVEAVEAWEFGRNPEEKKRVENIIKEL